MSVRKRIQRCMKVEQTGNEKPNFLLILYLFAGAILVIVIAVVIVISWRNRKPYTPPFSKHPVSMLSGDAGGQLPC